MRHRGVTFSALRFCVTFSRLRLLYILIIICHSLKNFVLEIEEGWKKVLMHVMRQLVNGNDVHLSKYRFLHVIKVFFIFCNVRLGSLVSLVLVAKIQLFFLEKKQSIYIWLKDTKTVLDSWKHNQKMSANNN